MKKILNALLSALFCAALFAFFVALNSSNTILTTAKAAETLTEGNYTYSVTDNSATITDFSTDYVGEVNIPDALGGYTVTTIGENAFQYCTGITAINLPDTVSEIKDYAFGNCTGLTSFTMPDNTVSVGYYAFYGCSAITTFHVGASYRYAANESKSALATTTPFVGLTGLKSFDASEKAQYITVIDGVLYRKNLSSLTILQYPPLKEEEVYNIPSEATDIINDNVFFDVPALKEINKTESDNHNIYSVDGVLFNKQGGIIKYPQAKTDRSYYIKGQYIAAYAFYKAKNLEAIYIHGNIHSIGKYAFAECSSLFYVVDSSTTRYGSYSFKNTAIEILYLSVNNLGTSNCFSDMPKLKAVCFTGLLSNITAESAFDNCPLLNEIYIASSSGNAVSIADGCLPTLDDNSLLFVYSGSKEVKALCEKDGYTFCNLNYTDPTYTFENGVLTVEGEGAIKTNYTYNGYPWSQYKDSAEKIIIGDGITAIGSYAFRDFSETTLVLGKKTRTISSYAFSNNKNLQSISFGEHIFSLEDSCFSKNSSLTEITLPESIYIFNAPFNNCDALSNIDISRCRIPILSGKPFAGCNALTNLSLPDSLIYLDYSFDCTGIKKLTIGKHLLDKFEYGVENPVIYPYVASTTLEAIGISSENPSLTVADGNIVSKDGKNFYCVFPTTQQSSITLDPRTEFVAPKAFSNNDSVTDIYIDNSSTALKSIDGVLFDINGKLLFYRPTRTQTTYVIPDFATSIPDNAFFSNTNLEKITIGKNVTYIGRYAFYGSKLTVCDMSSSAIEEIDSYAFYKSALTELVFPSTLKTIKYGAFSNLKIESVIIPDSVESIGDGAFSDCSQLLEASIGRGVVTLPARVFANCTALTEVHITPSTTSINTAALPTFEDNSSLTIWSEINSTAHKFAIDNGYSFAEDGSYNIKFSFNDGILTLSGSGDTLDFSDAKYAPWAAYANDIVSVVITDGITRIGTNALGNLPLLRFVVFNANNTVHVAERAFSGDDMLANVVLLSPADFSASAFENAGLGAEIINLTECDSSAHSGTLPTNVVVHLVEFNNGNIFISGSYSGSAYDIFDTVTVFAGKFGEIKTLTFDEFTAEDIAFFFYDKNGRRRSVENNTLVGCTFGVEIDNGEDDGRVRISFNELSDMLANGDTDRFSLVVLSAENIDFDVIDTDIEIDDGSKPSFIQQVMKWIVTMLNKMFAFFSKFFGKK